MKGRWFSFLIALLLAMGWSFAQTPARGGTLQIGADASPSGLDPHVATAFASFIVTGQIYEGLTEIDERLRPRPALAESWTVSQDGLTYTFKIRSGVTFHDGKPLTASDVAFSINRVRDPKTGSPIASRVNLIKEVRATSPTQLVVELSQPFAPMLIELASIAVMSEDYVKAGNDMQRKPMGTGPFAFKEWVPDTYILLERHPRYWRQGRPYLDALRYNIVPDAATRQVGLASAPTTSCPTLTLRWP